MTLLIGALTIGLILSLLAMGVFITFRIFDLADITVDGSVTLGASITAVLLVAQVNPLFAMLLGFGGGFIAGMITGVLQTKFRINPLLSGILVMTALYSVNLHVMGKSNVPLLSARTLTTFCEDIGVWIWGNTETDIFGWIVSTRDVAVLLLVLIVVSLTAALLFLFFRTAIGTAMRASGDNAQMIRALGANVELYRIIGLAISNALVAFAGALLAQYQGFSDAQMGIGMVVTGLASVIIGESLTGSRGLGLAIIGAIMGSVIFRLLVAIALRWGLNPNDLKLITALFVFAALVLPQLISKARRRNAHA